MIDVASMDYLTVPQYGHTSANEYQILDESSMAEKRPITRCDLIFDSYIHPETLRHMTIPTVRQHNATQEAMRQLVGDFHTTDVEIMTSSMDKKRFRLPPRDASSNGRLPRMDAVQYTAGHDVHCTNDPTPVVVEAVENDDSTYTSKRVKRGNGTMNEVSLTDEVWKFLPYPNHKDIDITMKQFHGISQLLDSWDQFAYIDRIGETEVLRQKDELEEECMYNVEHALLDFHVTSDDWNQHAGNFLSDCNGTEQHHDTQDRIECDKMLPSESSSVSTISYVEEQHVPPPTLLRVTTSTILEEQELIWRKIKQEQDDPCPAPIYNTNALWQHEVTRGHHVRPPLSPQSRRIGSIRQTSMPTGIFQESGIQVPEAHSNGMFGFSTPTSENRKIKGIASEHRTILKPNTSFQAGLTVRPVQVTPTKGDGTRFS